MPGWVDPQNFVIGIGVEAVHEPCRDGGNRGYGLKFYPCTYSHCRSIENQRGPAHIGGGPVEGCATIDDAGSGHRPIYGSIVGTRREIVRVERRHAWEMVNRFGITVELRAQGPTEKSA